MHLITHQVCQADVLGDERRNMQTRAGDYRTQIRYSQRKKILVLNIYSNKNK